MRAVFSCNACCSMQRKEGPGVLVCDSCSTYSAGASLAALHSAQHVRVNCVWGVIDSAPAHLHQSGVAAVPVLCCCVRTCGEYAVLCTVALQEGPHSGQKRKRAAGDDGDEQEESEGDDEDE